MKTIEQAQDEHSLYKDGDGFSFRAGAEFAQRFIPIEKEMPPIKEDIIFKHHNGYEVMFFMSNYFREKYISYYPKSSWRPINIK